MSAAIPRRVRRIGGRLIRRWGLLPEGDPDGLGDDEMLRGQTLPFHVMVYFPDTVPNLYQLRQWYAPLRALAQRHPVGVVCLDSRTAATLRAELDLPVICAGRIATLDDLVSRSDIALALYVNHNVRNLHPLRFATMLHAYVGHGESDKIASASNQVKAYDFVLVAGVAARDRLARALMRYDVDAHVRLVGRPQLDGAHAAAQPRAASTRPTVIYAPTWEGAQPSMAYSSVRSHGSLLLSSLLDSGKFRVVYRPHPRTGANDVAFSAADQELRVLIQQFHRREPEVGHAVDSAPAWDPRHDSADILITDISAVASDWMTTGKPILVTAPADPAAFVDADSVLNAVPVLTAAGASRAAELVSVELAGAEPSGSDLPGSDNVKRQAWVRRTFGDLGDGAATQQFLAVCDELIAMRATELAARSARMSGGAQ